MGKPIIGLSGSHLISEGGMFPGYRRAYINHDYVRSVAENGGSPLILPWTPEAHLDGTIDGWMKQIDGVILSGGHDLFPPFYGEECRQKLTEVWPARDIFDKALLESAVRHGKPVFGICRGYQIINVTYGSKLLQDLSYADHELLRHWQGSGPEIATQQVKFVEGTPFHEWFGESLMVNSFHHQVVMETGPDLIACGHTSDGVVEAIVHRSLPVYGVQWHPEMMSAVHPEMARLFALFIEKCGGGCEGGCKL